MTLAIPVTGLLAALLCYAYLRVARTWHILAIPNERSSHSDATPSGGGIALMLALAFGLAFAAWTTRAWSNDFLWLSAAAIVLSMLGFIDDLRGLAMPLRLLAYSLVCLWTSWVILPPWPGGSPGGLVLLCLAALMLLWALNLYNFMDGIDGIAALQAVLACAGAAWLSARQGGESGYVLFCLLLGAVHCGFLVWNFPPARLFMGDAGSVPTGFLLAGLALLGAVRGSLNPLCWLVLLAVFVTDASWTLAARAVTGQPFTQAHRSHAYQRLSRRWNSHLKVDVLLLTINLLWLFPIALAIQLWPDNALIMVILAYVPLLSAMAKVRGMT